MNESVILAACRTPIGKFRGRLARLPATELGATALRACVERSGVEPRNIEEVILGNVLSSGVGQAPARQAALRAGLPDAVAALTINKVCGSGLKAVMLADQAIRAGDARLIAAGGMESMSRAPYLLPRDAAPLGDRRLIDAMLHDGLQCAFSGKGMGQIADELARREGVSRSEQDEFAAESHARAIRAIDSGAFQAEIVPVPLASQTEPLREDEGPRRDTTVARLAELAPVFSAEGSITAGNASMISDGAAAVLIGQRQYAQQNGWQPLARIVAQATAGGSPEDLFLAPVAAIRQVVDRANLRLEQIDLFEINEAFAAQMCACLAHLKLDSTRVNRHGGAVALGHPIGASGTRVLVTLCHSLRRYDLRFGLAALCLGGGNAVAVVIERL